MDKERVIEVAVNWWADKISNRHRHSNGDNSEASVRACLLADIGYKVLTDEQIETFKRELTTLLTEEYEERFEKLHLTCTIDIGCDYGPCVMLDKAARIAGINVLNFPFKTYMSIAKDSVKVSDGYCEPYVKIGD